MPRSRTCWPGCSLGRRSEQPLRAKDADSCGRHESAGPRSGVQIEDLCRLACTFPAMWFRLPGAGTCAARSMPTPVLGPQDEGYQTYTPAQSNKKNTPRPCTQPHVGHRRTSATWLAGRQTSAYQQHSRGGRQDDVLHQRVCPSPLRQLLPVACCLSRGRQWGAAPGQQAATYT